jgi:hypothetical protein
MRHCRKRPSRGDTGDSGDKPRRVLHPAGALPGGKRVNIAPSGPLSMSGVGEAFRRVAAELRLWRRKLDFRAILRVDQGCAGCQFNRRPVLLEEISGVVVVERIYSNAACLPAVPVRNLKMKNEANRFLVFLVVIAAHSVSPLFCVELGQFRFANLPFVRRDYGAGAAVGLDRARLQ